MAAKKLEIALVSAGLILLGAIGYYVLPRPTPGHGRERHQAPTASPVPRKAPEWSAQGRIQPVEVMGMVRDRLTGEAVSHVSVSFRSESNIDQVALSDATGKYGLELLPGRYRVRALGVDVAAFDDAVLVIAPELGKRTLDIDVLRLAQIQGQVVDGNGEAISGVAISHRTRVFDRVLDTSDTAPAGSATSETDGSFLVRVPPGEVTLIARAAERPESTTMIRWVQPGAHISGVEIVMDAGAALSGRVVDPTGSPVAGALVMARSSEEMPPPIQPWGRAPGQASDQASGQPSSESPVARTGPDGTFVLRALVPGQVLLHAEAPGFAPSSVVSVNVEENKEARDVVLALQEAKTIAGRVTDQSGRPVAGASVAARPMMGSDHRVETGTDESGAFELRGLGSGPFLLTATAAGFAPARQSGVTAPARQVELVVTAASALHGLVTSQGAPLHEFMVNVQPRFEPGLAQAEPIRLRFASRDGTYRIDDLAPGLYDVMLSTPGLAPALVPGVRLPAGGEAPASADLGKGATLSGKVMNARSGAPVSGAMVVVTTGSATPATYTNLLGAFTISDITAGRRGLEAHHPAYVGKIESGLELGVGQQKSLDIMLEPLAFGADTTIEFAGIGAVIRMQGENLVIESLVAHGPASVAGLMSKDEIVSIDGRSTRGRSLGESIEDIRGVVGTVVRIGVRRGTAEFERDIVRGTVRVTPDALPPGPEPSPEAGPDDDPDRTP